MMRVSKVITLFIATIASGSTFAAHNGNTFLELDFGRHAPRCDNQVLCDVVKSTNAVQLKGSYEFGTSGVYVHGVHRNVNYASTGNPFPAGQPTFKRSTYSEAGVGYEYRFHPAVRGIAEAALGKSNYRGSYYNWTDVSQSYSKSVNSVRLSVGAAITPNETVEITLLYNRYDQRGPDVTRQLPPAVTISKDSIGVSLAANVYRDLWVKAGMETSLNTSKQNPVAGGLPGFFGAGGTLYMAGIQYRFGEQ